MKLVLPDTYHYCLQYVNNSQVDALLTCREQRANAGGSFTEYNAAMQETKSLTIASNRSSVQLHLHLAIVFAVMAAVAWPPVASYRNYGLSALCILLSGLHLAYAAWRWWWSPTWI